MTSDVKKLYRSNDNTMLLGVCAGLAAYLGMDPTVVRVITLLLCLVTGVVPLLVIYVIAGFIIPVAPGDDGTQATIEAGSEDASALPESGGDVTVAAGDAQDANVQGEEPANPSDGGS